MRNSSRISTLLSGITELVDPSKIITTSEWYLLSHVSGTLVAYSHELGRFVPSIAESWSVKGNELVFKIRSDAKFSDGSSLTSRDVEKSLKRQIIKKTATHFPIWEQIVDCENVHDIKQPCAGILTPDPQTIIFVAKRNVESCFLMLASPEGGIWWSEDLLQSEQKINASKYSGAYAFERDSQNKCVLRKNKYSPVTKSFPDAPDLIDLYSESGTEAQKLFEDKKIDVYIDSIQPFQPDRYEAFGYHRNVSGFTTILYLSKIGDHSKFLGRDFFKKFWSEDLGKEIAAADSILPFHSLRQIDRKSFLDILPSETTQKKITIAILQPYFNPRIAEIISKVGTDAGIEIEMKPVGYKKWVELNSKRTIDPDYDFVFTIYVASERYPSVQIRFLLDGRTVPFNYDAVDSIETTSAKREVLFKFEKWMLETQQILPLMFTRMQIVSLPDVDIGLQPVSDAEIQLWRVKKLR